jgi:hypothetical protein
MDDHRSPAKSNDLGVVTFRVLPHELGNARFMLVVMIALACVLNYFGVVIAKQEGGVLGVAIAGVVGCITLIGPVTAVVFMRRARREGELSIDPVRGEIQIGRSYEISFSRVRQVEVVEHEYTYTAMGPELSTSSSDIKGWAIDIGAGVRLCGENGLSRERVVEIADALNVRVEAYRARTGQFADSPPWPRDLGDAPGTASPSADETR